MKACGNTIKPTAMGSIPVIMAIGTMVNGRMMFKTVRVVKSWLDSQLSQAFMLMEENKVKVK